MLCFVCDKYYGVNVFEVPDDYLLLNSLSLSCIDCFCKVSVAVTS